MTTLWVSTAGDRFISRSQIPYQNMVTSLLLFMASSVIGLLIRRFLPRAAEFIVKALKVFNLILILFFVTFGKFL